MSTSVGSKAEDKACRYLERRGYKILGRNVRGARGEIDVIALHQDLLVFIEVKAHRLRQRSIEAVHEGKQRRIISAAQAWLSTHVEYASLQCRFDLIMLTPVCGLFRKTDIEHIQDAFRG